MTEQDKNDLIERIKAGKKLPKEFIYKLFADEEDVFPTGAQAVTE